MSVGSQRRSFQIDVAMAVALFVLALLSLSAVSAETDLRPLDPLAYFLLAAQTLSLAWRRQFPVVVLGVVVGAFVIERGLNYPESWAVFGIAFALYTVGTQLDARRAMIVGGSAIALIVAWTAVGVVSYDLPAFVIVTVFGFTTFPSILGMEARRREQRMLSLEARAIRTEFDREKRASDAVAEERARIARELHDVIAHEVTVMTIQAGAAKRILDSDPERAGEALTAIETSGHQALNEMRRMLGLLRRGGDADTVPQPGVAALDGLVAQISDAGVSVRLSVDETCIDLPSGVDVNAYRIVQESLTNVVKHGGPGTSVDVDIRSDDGLMTIDVKDNGRGASQALTTGDGGHGLVGMRERVNLLGGSFEAGPCVGGGYRVHASIPMEQ